MQKYIEKIVRLTNRTLSEHDCPTLPDGVIPVLGWICATDTNSKISDTITFRLVNDLGVIHSNTKNSKHRTNPMAVASGILQVGRNHLQHENPKPWVSRSFRKNVQVDVICLNKAMEEALLNGRAWVVLDRVRTDDNGLLVRS